MPSDDDDDESQEGELLGDDAGDPDVKDEAEEAKGDSKLTSRL